jgi:hypothetical protein
MATKPCDTCGSEFSANYVSGISEAEHKEWEAHRRQAGYSPGRPPLPSGHFCGRCRLKQEEPGLTDAEYERIERERAESRYELAEIIDAIEHGSPIG